MRVVHSLVILTRTKTLMGKCVRTGNFLLTFANVRSRLTLSQSEWENLRSLYVPPAAVILHNDFSEPLPQPTMTA